MCNQSTTTDKRSGSDDKERERIERGERSDRDRDRERERDRSERERDRDRGGGGNGDRGERLTRIGDWSEHVSSSGKKYYYNCKTEVSQWEKPKEWLEKERYVICDNNCCMILIFFYFSALSKEHHREYREKERDRDREDRFSRSCKCGHHECS